MSISIQDFDPLKSRHSPEGRAHAVRAASIREMWAQEDYLPNPAGLTALHAGPSGA